MSFVSRFLLISVLTFAMPFLVFLSWMALERWGPSFPQMVVGLILLAGFFFLFPVEAIDDAFLGGDRFSDTVVQHMPEGMSAWFLYLWFYLVVAMVVGLGAGYYLRPGRRAA